MFGFTGCENCGRVDVRGPPLPIELQQFCSTDCYRASLQKPRPIDQSQPPSPVVHQRPRVLNQFRRRPGVNQGQLRLNDPSLILNKTNKSGMIPVRPAPVAQANSSELREIERIGKEICKTHMRALEDQQDGDGESSTSSSSNLEDFFQKESSPSPSNSVHDFDIMPPKKKKKKVAEDDSFSWKELIKNPEFKAASVSLVEHAPLARIWENVTVSMKLEVENTDIYQELMETAFWVASVIKIQGYFVLLRYEGFGNDSSADFWVNLCSQSVHHVGWCANKGKPLIPPKSIARKFTDWRNFLVNRLSGARTLPINFVSKIEHGIKSQNQLGDKLEVVDKNRISQLRVASVKQIVGRRLHVEYFDSTEDGGFWCHEESSLIHELGWAKTIGHRILEPLNYNPSTLVNTSFDAEYETWNLQAGMKLEAIDPLNVSAICAATIKQVLKRGFVMVQVDCYEEDSSGADWFCYHISSPYVYHCGYCASNGVSLTPPHGYDRDTFTWDAYFRETKAKPAPVKVKEVLNHKFLVGMKVEVADLMDPRLICVATISQVVGSLLKIHFDGWEDEYDQWMDARSPDIYPIGWCEIVGHRLEPPRPPAPVQRPPAVKKPKKGKKKMGVRGSKGAGSKLPVKIAKAAIKAAGVRASNTNRNNDGLLTPMKSAAASSQPFQTVEVNRDLKPMPASNNVSKVKTHLITDVQKPSSNVGSQKILDVPKGTSNAFNSIGLEAWTSKTAKYIPKSFDNADTQQSVEPLTWSIEEVAKFLTSHDCGPYCDGFIKNDIDGEKLMALTKDQIVLLTGMKVVPAVKIFELISQLKKFASAAKARKFALSK